MNWSELPIGIVFAIAIVLGLALGWMAYRLYRAGLRRAAEVEAEEIVSEIRDASELQDIEHQERFQEIETEAWSKIENEMQALDEKIEELEALVEENKQKSEQTLHRVKSSLGQVERDVQSFDSKTQNKQKALEAKRDRNRQHLENLTKELATRLGVERDGLVASIGEELVGEAERRGQKTIELREADATEQAEAHAKVYLERALNRFHRPYSAERGIAPVYFTEPGQRKILCDPENKNLKLISELTGCDIIVQDDMEMVGVAGFDPVRRELTRRVLERLLKEKKLVQPEFIQRTVENIKRELLSLIKKDGDIIAKELKLEGLHPEIRQMMGSLRYRYSFTQNQYFHCGEVGWLCGLLAQEMRNAPVKKARRAGLLHDLGKSMDHDMDGGHAVIGANFINERGEAPDVVHAVRAHHYDETPSTDMAFLVIAADAMSGARPGARRSTLEAYSQKVNELDAIARSFPGVTECIVLNGGRECRVMVNSRQIDDFSALKLSRKIADRIQEECNYPGQIKVVVVRETVVSESTRSGS